MGNQMIKFQWWRIVLAVICAAIPSLYFFVILLSTHNNIFFGFVTDFLRLEGVIANIVAYCLLFSIPLIIGGVFGSVLGRKPRFLYGLISGIFVAIIQGIHLGLIFFALSTS
jgi:hypothetical protein